jgi:hypothetical protein
MKNKYSFFLLLVLLISFHCYGFIKEEFYLYPGDLYGYYTQDNGFGVPYYIPETNMALILSNGKSTGMDGHAVVIDLDKERFLGRLNYEFLQKEAVIVADHYSCDAYQVFGNYQFGKFHISKDGEISPPQIISSYDDSYSNIQYLKHPHKNEIFIFGSKIFRYVIGETMLNSIDLPEGFLQNKNDRISAVNLIQGTNLIIIQNEGLNNKQGLLKTFLFDLDNHTHIILPDIYLIEDLKSWINHDGKYIFITYESTPLGDLSRLYSFDIANKRFDVIIDPLPDPGMHLIQDESGEKIFLPNNGSSQLLIINANEKTYEYVDLAYNSQEFNPVNEFILYANWFEIPGKNKILTTLKRYFNAEGQTLWTNKPAIIDLLKMDIKITNPLILGNINLGVMAPVYFEGLNKIVLNPTSDTLAIIYPDTLVSKALTSFGGDNSRTIKLINGKIYSSDYYFSGLSIFQVLIGKGESIDGIGHYLKDFEFLPKGNELLLLQENPLIDESPINPIKFNFKSGSSFYYDIIPDKGYELFQDPSNNQTISYTYSNKKVYFFNDSNNFDVWDFPYENKILSRYVIFDDELGYLWIGYDESSERSKGNLLRLSTNDKTIINYELPQNYHTWNNWALYNHDEYLCIFTKEGGVSWNLTVIELDNKEIVFSYPIFSNYDNSLVLPTIIPIPSEDSICLWDGRKAWRIDTSKWTLIYGGTYDNTKHLQIQNLSVNIKSVYDENYRELVIFDTAETFSILRVDIDTGYVKKSFNMDDEQYGYPLIYNPIFDLKNRQVHYQRKYIPSLVTVRLDDDWDNAPTIKPQGQFVEYRPGDTFRLILDIANPADVPQDVTAYIWFWLPTGQYVFFGPNGLTTDIKGIPLTLPANLDTSISIDLFIVPQGMPAGFYNLNAVFFNNRTAVRGPMGTYNFMTGQ